MQRRIHSVLCLILQEKNFCQEFNYYEIFNHKLFLDVTYKSGIDGIDSPYYVITINNDS